MYETDLSEDSCWSLGFWETTPRLYSSHKDKDHGASYISHFAGRSAFSLLAGFSICQVIRFARRKKCGDETVPEIKQVTVLTQLHGKVAVQRRRDEQAIYHLVLTCK